MPPAVCMLVLDGDYRTVCRVFVELPMTVTDPTPHLLRANLRQLRQLKCPVCSGNCTRWSQALIETQEPTSADLGSHSSNAARIPRDGVGTMAKKGQYTKTNIPQIWPQASG